MSAAPGPGSVVRLDVEAAAHGGHCVARIDGQVVFVRHALPGETVMAVITASGRGGRLLRASVTEVLEPSPDRVAPPCPYAGACGGCDWQHAALDAQRRIKGGLVRDALGRAGVDPALVPDAQSVDGDEDGLRWRTRMRWAVDSRGRLGLRRHRSHEVVPVASCLLAARGIDVGELRGPWPAGAEVAATAPSQGAPVAEVVGRTMPRVSEAVGSRSWQVRADGFWQVHPGAAGALSTAVRELAQARPGDLCWDLYAGVGLFADVLAEEVGETGRVDMVEASASACRDARRNLHGRPWVSIHESAVLAWVRSTGGDVPATVVLDPPRSGAGIDVVRALLSRGPGRVVYVSCDPMTLARDVAVFGEAGWRADDVRVLDLFPMTGHVEVVARLIPG